MKNRPLLRPDGIRPLLLAIVRASVAGAAPACVPEPLQTDADAAVPVDAATTSLHTSSSGEEAGTPQQYGAAPRPEAGAAPSDALPPADAAPPVHAVPPGADAAAPGPDAGSPRADAEPPEPDARQGSAEWERVPCEAGIVNTGQPTGAAAPDALSVYADVRFLQGPTPNPNPHNTSELVRAGALCSGVVERAACEQQVEGLRSQICPTDLCRFAIGRDGENITRIDTRAELVALLGSIDAPAEALVLAAFDGHALCRGGFSGDARDIGTEVRLGNGGYELRITREQCGTELYRDHLTVAADGTLVVVSHEVLARSLCAIGRRPAGWRAARARASCTRVGAFLAQAAELEAASVLAFYQLLRELRALRAPAALRTAVCDALLDEVRHARDVGALARAFGGEVVAPEIEATGLRSAFELAIDNVSEGCVRETFGALQATYQAETAADPRVRSVMAQIAEDESRHAQLSWALRAWLESQLSTQELAQVDEASESALSALASDLDPGLSCEECALLGFPTPEVSRSMLRSLSQALYA